LWYRNRISVTVLFKALRRLRRLPDHKKNSAHSRNRGGVARVQHSTVQAKRATPNPHGNTQLLDEHPHRGISAAVATPQGAALGGLTIASRVPHGVG
jgi:hypothetical protein